MSNKLNDIAAVAGILSLVIGGLALVRDVFDYKLPWLSQDDAIAASNKSRVVEEKTVELDATKHCINSDMVVSTGDSVQFSATGQATYGYEGSPVNSAPYTNPDGERFVNGKSIGKKSDPNALIHAPIGILIGKISEEGKFFPSDLVIR